MINISKLAFFIRENGNEILNYDNKLTLTVSLLYSLNKAFTQIFEDRPNDSPSTSFEVLSTNNSKNEVFYNLQFLYDFVQKVVGLKIEQDLIQNAWSSEQVNVTKFKSIRFLELKKVSIQNIIGKQTLCSKLQSIICVRCLNKVEELLASGGDDLVWSELEEAVLSYNNLDTLDQSLSLAPCIQVLDVSHNRIIDARGLESLPNLKYLNLSYNKLTHIPSLHKEALPKLQILVIKNNFIEELSGLTGLNNLTELDLSCNCIISHSLLASLSEMSVLNYLNLQGNPLSFHKDHRVRTLRRLHHNVAHNQFVLDGARLSRMERFVIGTFDSSEKISPSQTSDDSSVGTNTIPVPSLPLHGNQDCATTGRVQGRKGGRVREAIIKEPNGRESEKQQITISSVSKSLDVSYDHLKTKKQIETLRSRFGENDWLHSQGGSCLQDVLGLQKSSELETSQHSLETTDSKLEAVTIPDTLTSVVSDPSSADHSTSPGEEGEVEKHLYLVQAQQSATTDLYELFLVITDSHIQEHDAQSGHTLKRWDISSLLSCTVTVNHPPTVHLTFDTVRSDGKERVYIMEDADCQQLVHILGEMLESRSLRDMNQSVFKCMKCSALFSQECLSTATASSGANLRDPSCPVCGSTVVIISGSGHQDTSSSRSSTGQMGSMIDVSAMVHRPASPPTITTLVIADSSVTSLEHSSSIRRSGSDIEIISNPSQSSIEILQDNHRKQSSEEPAAVPQAPTFLGDGGMVRTESSSSGSLTDSICTTYENHVINKTPSQDTAKHTLGILSDDVSTVDKPVTYSSILSDDVSTVDKPVTYSSMLEGLKQSVSTKLLSDSLRPASPGAQDIYYSYKDFAAVDHRIKLHLYLHIFEDDQEELILLLRAQIVSQNTKTPFFGCIVMSTTKIYILRVTGKEGEEPEKWLKKESSWPAGCLSLVLTLPWEQGLCLELKHSHYLVLLQDSQRTNNFISFLSGLILPDNYRLIVHKISDEHLLLIQQLILSVCNSDSHVQLLVIFSRCFLGGNHQELGVGTLLITDSSLVLTKDSVDWLFPHSTCAPRLHCSQEISNLIEVEVNGFTLTLYFMDEVSNSEEGWNIVVETNEAVHTIVEALRSPWERLFSLPLQIVHKDL